MWVRVCVCVGEGDVCACDVSACEVPPVGSMVKRSIVPCCSIAFVSASLWSRACLFAADQPTIVCFADLASFFFFFFLITCCFGCLALQ